MHEMSIAVQLVDQVVELARRHQATRVEEIEVAAGVMRQVVPEALEFAFSFASEGTLAAGARLHVVEEELLAVCNDCGCKFVPRIDNFLCVRCERANVRLIAGNDIILKSVVCEAPEGVSAP